MKKHGRWTVSAFMCFLCLSIMVHAEEPPGADPRLVAQYLFENSHNDSSGNGHHAVESGTFRAVNGDQNPLADVMAADPERGHVYSYTTPEVFYDWSQGGNPNNNRIDLESALPLPNLPENEGITLMAWVKREAVNSMPNDGRIEFASVIHLGTCGDFPIATLAFDSEGKVAGFIEGDLDQVLVIGDTFVAPNEWHHIAISYDRVGNIATTYVDGIAQAVPTDITSAGNGELDWAQAFIGGFCSSSRGFVGRIDDARIYYDALTAAEIETIVAENRAPTLEEFSVDTDFLTAAGGSVTLSWSASDQCELILTPGDLVIDQGTTSMMVTPSESTTYTLTARNGTASVSRSLTVLVGEAPRILNFTADRPLVRYGGQVEFNFEVVGAETLALDQGVDIDSATATVTAETTYQLTATNAAGTSTADVNVEVTPVPEATFLIDFGSSSFVPVRPDRLAEDGNYWNQLLNYRDGCLESLVDTNNDASQGIALKVSNGFDGLFNSETIGAGATTYLSNAVRDTFFANALTSDGTAELKLSHLDTTGLTTYDFTFFASLDSEILDPFPGVNLQVQYTVVGQESISVTIDGADNLDETVTVRDIIPAVDGTILIRMAPANTASAGSGLNVLQIDSRRVLVPLEILSLALNPAPTITWRSEFGRNYIIERSTDLKMWDDRTDDPIATGMTHTWEDPEPLEGGAFYRVRALGF